MDVQYIKDDKEDEPMEERSELEKPFDVMDYFGIITLNMSDEQLFDELNQLRSEWDRYVY